VTVRAEAVDPVVRVARVTEDLLFFFEPGIGDLPHHGHVPGGVGFIDGGERDDVIRRKGVGRWPAGTVDQEDPLTVHHLPPVLDGPNSSAEGLDVGHRMWDSTGEAA
jgi:hypothetical protein